MIIHSNPLIASINSIPSLDPKTKTEVAKASANSASGQIIVTLFIPFAG